MKFDSNRAWQEAVASVSANRDVLFAVAGVFFLLPAIVSTLFLSDVQTALLANLGNPEAAEQVMEGHMGAFLTIGLGTAIVQLIGYLALLALLTDRQRPTVGQAIMTGIRSLPSLLAATILFVAGYVMLAAIYGMVATALGAALGLPALTFTLLVLFLALIVYVTVKFSLTLPVIIIERVMNPVTALMRSWHLTAGNSLRLFVFYLLLFLAYFAISLVAALAFMSVFSLAGDAGTMSLLFAGVVSGLIGAVASVLFTAILAAIHRQLAGPSPSTISQTFD